MVVPAVVGVAVVEAVLFALSGRSGGAWGAAVMAPAIVLLSAPVLSRAGKRENDARLGPLLLWALVLKLLGALLRYSILTDVYDSVGDAPRYHEAGRVLAGSFRAADFDVDVGKVVGSGFIEIVTGVIYAIVGTNPLSGFLVFSWLGFWGLYFFYKAFVLACPNGDRRRYALLLFLLPSLLFWPSSIGKEAWMMLALGVAAYGAARIITRSRGGFLVTSVGLLGTAMVRPHVTLMVLLALAVAYFIRRSPERSALGPFAKLAGVITLVVAATVVVGQAEEFLGVDTLNQEGIEEASTRFGANTEQGGSSFEATRARSPADLPAAAISVLFRPFPHEAHNVQALAASLEGLFLLGCFVVSCRRLLAVPKAMVRTPYVAMACVYALLFIYAFSTFGNFGLITRERVQLFPFILIIFALPMSVYTSPRRPVTPSPVATPELVA